MKNFLVKMVRLFAHNFFMELIESRTLKPLQKYEDAEIEKSYEHFKQYFPTSMLFTDKETPDNLRHYSVRKAMKLSKPNELFLEFGVYKGNGINMFAKILDDIHIYGFDTFTGFAEDWIGTDKPVGHFNPGVLPDVKKNVHLIKGEIEDTLNPFLLEHCVKGGKKIRFINFDFDIYQPTLFALKAVKPHLADNCIILFDELYNHGAWRSSEYKALTETFSSEEYRYLAFDAGTKATIQYVPMNDTK